MTTDTRRTFLRRAGLSGLAISIGGSLLSLGQFLPAGAQEQEELGERDILDFLREFELALVEIYRSAAAGGLVTTAAGQGVVNAYGAHHQAHADALAAGGARPSRPRASLMQALSDRLGGRGDEKGVLAYLYDLENGAAATHLFASGIVENTQNLTQLSAILPVEAAHAVAIGDLLGREGDAVLVAFQTEEGRADPTLFAEGESE